MFTLELISLIDAHLRYIIICQVFTLYQLTTVNNIQSISNSYKSCDHSYTSHDKHNITDLS